MMALTIKWKNTREERISTEAEGKDNQDLIEETLKTLMKKVEEGIEEEVTEEEVTEEEVTEEEGKEVIEVKEAEEEEEEKVMIQNSIRKRSSKARRKEEIAIRRLWLNRNLLCRNHRLCIQKQNWMQMLTGTQCSSESN
jgi:preprotein translocase subunit SecD